MELGTQIKKYRNEKKLSQEELAEKIYVSRQTISNWENDKNYPDIKSLLLLSQFFGISLDILVKGDLKEMKEQIKEEEVKQFKREGIIFSILMAVMLISAIPLAWFLGNTGRGIWCVLAVITVLYSFRIEKWKKNYNIQTYKEITAFYEGKTLDEIDRQREYGKRPYQKILLAIGAALIALAVCSVMGFVLSHLFG